MTYVLVLVGIGCVPSSSRRWDKVQGLGFVYLTCRKDKRTQRVGGGVEIAPLENEILGKTDGVFVQNEMTVLQDWCEAK